MNVQLIPPPPQMLSAPGTIRWAVGNAAGPRSHTWSVVGHGNTDDVFVGIRDHMGVMKLSLHPAKWRMAFTEQAAAQHLPPDADRVVTRWEKPGDIAAGWKHAATVIVLMSNLGPAFPEKRVRRGASVAWFPATRPGTGLRFDVMLGTPDREALTVENCIGEVGRLTMRSGSEVWIVGTDFRTTPEFERYMANVRQTVHRDAPADVQVRGWAWGSTPEGVPMLLDLSRLAAE